MLKLKRVDVVASLVPERGTPRRYALFQLVNSFGFGLILPAMALYGTRVVHISGPQVGLGMTIAAAVSLVTAVPLGDLADRYGPREMVSFGLVIQCLAALSYLFVRNFTEFMVVATVDTVSLGGLSAADGALLRRIGGENPAAFRASIRSLINLGLSLGLVGNAIAVQVGTASAYRALFLFNGLTFVAAFAVSWRLPRYEPLPKPAVAARWVALTDKAYAGFTALNGLMALQYPVLVLLLPLWIVAHTHAPRWSISVIVFLNTILVTLLQVRIGRQVKTVRNGGVALRRAGVLFLFSCSAMGLATGLPAWAALLLLGAAVVLHTLGEIWQSSGAFAVSYGLAAKHATGQYMGVARIGSGIGAGVAPLVLLGLVLPQGRAGWIGLAILFALLGLAAPALARWGERTRPPAEQPGHAEQTDHHGQKTGAR
jgi:predicted MFS family arabinose efflux permease